MACGMKLCFFHGREIAPAADLRSKKPAAGALQTAGLRNCALAFYGGGLARLVDFGIPAPHWWSQAAGWAPPPHQESKPGDTAMPKYTDQIAKIEERLEQQRQRLRDLKAQETKQNGRDDTRRKILYGAAFLSLVDKLPEEKRHPSLDRIQRYISRAKDREFLGLPPLDAS